MQKLRSNGFAPALLGLTALIAIGCGEKDEGAVPPPTTNNNNPSVTPDSGSTTPATTTDSGGTSSTNTGGTDAGSKPTIRPTMDASVPALDAQAPAADAASVDAGSVDGGSAGAGKKCTGGDMFACNTFVTIEGKEIPLGPYGATMEANVGMGFENPVNLLDDDGLCAAFAELGFMQDAMASAKLVDSSMIKLALYSVYRPANFVAGEKYPLITWGNGTCAQPEGYGALLRYVASHGFIVVAPNSRYIGDGTAQRKGIDFMTKLNSDMMSPYYQKVDLERVGAMGHSQGSGATTTASSDARIKSVILFNGGGAAASKPFLAVSGDTDIGNPTLASYKQTVSGTTQPAAYLFYHKVPMVGTNAGHLTLMTEPQRVTEATVAWFKYTLSKDEASKAFFIGTDCKLCNHTADYDYGHNDKL